MFAADLSVDPLTALARHPQLILIVVGGAVWLFKRAAAIAAANRPPRGDPRETAEAARRVGTADPSAEVDEASAERTRQVQAEVRRKIEERRRRPMAPPLVAPRPIAQPLSPPFGWPVGRGSKAETVNPPEATSSTPARRQVEPTAYASAPAQPPVERNLSADVVARNARVFAAATAATASAPAASAGSVLGIELREPNAARRAIILREILGPPVGLR
jgi:hypothetical protein